ncbi:MAG TPA: LD-carboxypeptidase, partial [Planctomycetota bacterium]|nr:LD-carboxypeptidase [Planctomycetota bacterium]
QDVVRAFSLEPRLGAHVRERHGYLAGRDESRAADVNGFFADSSVAGIFAIRGGWGCARILPLLDWDRIRRSPKVVAGYSDITGLHCGLHARTGLVTFHAPTLLSDWPPFSVDHFRRVLFEGEAVAMSNPPGSEERLVQRENRTRAITPGRARGRLLGGNLTVLSALVGTPYLPAFDGAILFLEDVNEHIYRVDRMLTQLGLAGLLRRLRGFVFGSCTDCEPGEGYGSLTLEEVLDEHVRPLGVPAYQGAMIGHQDRQFTIPIGTPVEMDAAAGTITMLEPAVA